MTIRYCLVLLVGTLLLQGCRFPKFEKPGDDVSGIPEFAIVFYEIDNEATVWVNSEEVFQNESNLASTDQKIVVDLKPFLKRGINRLDVKLKDIPNDRCLVNTWSVTYDIYSYGKIVDYWSEANPANDVCAEEYKVEKSYNLEY